MRKKIRKVIGSFLIFIGVIGLFVPVLQGWLLIFFGVALVENQWINTKIKILKVKGDSLLCKYFKN